MSGSRAQVPPHGWAHHFDSIAHQVDAEFEASTVRGHWRRARHAAALRLVGPGTGALLEIGTGSGRLLADLAGRGWTVTGLDPAPAMVAIARSRVPVERERIVIGEAESLPYPDASFDVVIAMGVLGFVDVDRALGEIARVLRPDCRAVLEAFDSHAATIFWQQRVVVPIARAVKRAVPFGRPLPLAHRSFAPTELRRLLADSDFQVEQEEHVGCAVVPDPLDRVLPHVAWRAAEAAEGSARLRRWFGTQCLVVATKQARLALPTRG
jgi:ubiquinone/menaquinone biosynthesis C-methylase UbiE